MRPGYCLNWVKIYANLRDRFISDSLIYLFLARQQKVLGRVSLCILLAALFL